MAKRGMGRRQSWAGAAVGAVALVLVLVLILFGRDSGGGQGQDCGRPLPLLVEVELDAAGFANAASSLARVVEAAEAGDLRAADEAFFAGGVHAFTHTVDATLRAEAPELAGRCARRYWTSRMRSSTRTRTRRPARRGASTRRCGLRRRRSGSLCPDSDA